jgi:putative oxidoreductase
MNNILKITARVLITFPIALFGYFHFPNAAMSASVVPAWLPGALFWVYFTGVIHIVYAVMVIGNIKYASWVSLLMAGILLFYALAIHLPGLLNAGGDQMKGMTEMGGMFTDIALAGAALYLAAELKWK